MSVKKAGKTPGEKRREAIMEAAWGMFLEKGYSAVSVDEIVKKAGGSKSSVYGFFGSKEGLFLELITSVNERIFSETRLPETSGAPTREALIRLSAAVMSQILSVKGIEMYRLAVSESKRFPRVGRVFFEAGPAQTRVGFAEQIAKETQKGRLKVKDPWRAAEFLLGMLLVRDHLAMSVGCASVPTKASIKEIAEEAVDVFLAAYGA